MWLPKVFTLASLFLNGHGFVWRSSLICQLQKVDFPLLVIDVDDVITGLRYAMSSTCRTWVDTCHQKQLTRPNFVCWQVKSKRTIPSWRMIFLVVRLFYFLPKYLCHIVPFFYIFKSHLLWSSGSSNSQTAKINSNV